METKTVHGWLLMKGLGRSGEPLIFLRDENGQSFTGMPMWELEYYLALCGNEFPYRQKLVSIVDYPTYRIIMPENMVAALPQWLKPPATVARWYYENMGLCYDHLLPWEAEFGARPPAPPF
jgi:hypothetical protein